MKFTELGLSPAALAAIEKKGFEEPSPIQELAIPPLLQTDSDIIAQAQTGTGKTAVFALAFLEKLEHSAKGIGALVLTPTRELAIQVTEEINSFTALKKIRAISIYGGQSYEIQTRQIRNGADIIVGTPGRLIDHLQRKTFSLADISFCVLDEADEMLNMGFIEDIEEILTYCGEKRRMLLFSATMPPRIQELAKKFMHNQQLVSAKNTEIVTDLVNQIYFEVRERDKFEALCRIIDCEEQFYGIVFCRTKVDADNTARHLSERGYSAEALHGDLSQSRREQILNTLRKGKLSVLVATDVAARGIDITDLTHVINYALPQDPESYVHRIGRTGRAGKAGTAITFITPDENRRLSMIRRIARTEIKKQDVPAVDQIIRVKKERLLKNINEIIDAGDHDIYQNLAEEIIAESDPKEALAAILKLGFADEFDSSRYKTISEIKKEKDDPVGASGKCRLFVTLGRRDKMKPALLASLIERQSGVKSSLIREIDIYDNFSFVTVPFKEAEIILERFVRSKRKSSFTVVRADRKSGAGQQRDRDRFRGHAQHRDKRKPRRR
ncbi:MAG: DEAD/DEAH box helicase [Spirochaetales bacterium]|nr:DEAD/DEAH box helicase [Spirochaetales bacterium]